MSADHSRDALMQRPYKALVMAMWFINLKSAVKYESLNAQEIGV